MNKVTYSPEDNKIRIYLGERLDRDTWNEFKTAGFTWTMKQSCDLVATWRVKREDLALTLLEEGQEVEDEQGTLLERSCDRAERFSGYLDKRREEAVSMAQSVSNEPIGYQNQEKADKEQAKAEKKVDKSRSIWSKAEYWEVRTEAVLNHALFKLDTGLRQRRIIDLKKDIRGIEDYLDIYKDEVSILTHYLRVLAHYKMRLQYEESMLKAQGGGSTVHNYEIGGFINNAYLINKINYVKGSKTEISSFSVYGNYCSQIKLDRVKSYTPPTLESIKAIEDKKAKEKASKPKAPSLINPTREEAQKLQDELNRQSMARIRGASWWNEEKEAERGFNRYQSEVVEFTQDEYKALSRGSYSHLKTQGFSAQWTRVSGYSNGEPIEFKVRTMSSREYNAPCHIIFITDTKAKALPELIEKLEAQVNA